MNRMNRRRFFRTRIFLLEIQSQPAFAVELVLVLVPAPPAN